MHFEYHGDHRPTLILTDLNPWSSLWKRLSMQCCSSPNEPEHALVKGTPVPLEVHDVCSTVDAQLPFEWARGESGKKCRRIFSISHGIIVAVNSEDRDGDLVPRIRIEA